ncbi:hypothetical protein [Bosea sp. UNC402CLCol]|uniref:hypothetical protein n=1 Tax=Bosea sp. UNC402CLCol TaxID=1510531 RepID=UPI000570B55E|nr:hypothetical protein [Bosea sp. UNC402CLCol]
MADSPINMDDARPEAAAHPDLAIRLFPLADAQAADALKPIPRQGVGSQSAQVYRYRWDRCGRKGQCCRVFARGTMNSAGLQFEDGFRMVSSGNALRRA